MTRLSDMLEEPMRSAHATDDAVMDTGVLLASIAVSLKRIADALQPTNQSGMNSIPEALHGIMLNGRG